MQARRLVFYIFIIIFAGTVRAAKAADSPLPGDLIKGSGQAVYYLAADGKRLVFPNESAYFSWYANFNGVTTIADEDLAAIPLGGLVTMRPGLKIIKFESSPKVYGVAHGGTLRWLSTESVAAMIFGADWQKKIVIVPDAFYSSYKYSTDVTAGGQYWWAKERDASPTIAADLDLSKAPDATVAVPVATNPVTPPPVVAPVAPPAPVAMPAPSVAVSRTIGMKNVLFVLFDPARPDAGAFDKQTLTRVLFGTAPSVADYYSIQSNGLAGINNVGILGWYAADKDAAHYWSNDATIHLNDGFKTGQAERLAEAMKKADHDFDFKKYDANNDGILSTDELAVFVVVPQSGDPTDSAVGIYSAEDPSTVPFTADGVTIAQVDELNISAPLGDKPQFGRMAHAIATFVFGFTDNPTSSQFSLTGSLPHLDQSLDPYTRINAGWITPTVIPKAIEVSQQTLTSALSNHPVIRVNRDQPGGNTSEYFLIENRERDIYDDSLPDSGIAIWDINGGCNLVRLDLANASTDTNALWHQGSSVAFTARELNWADGVRSGVRLLNLGYPDKVMMFTLEKKVLTDLDLVPLPSPIQ